MDMHVHLREPGREDKETIETGTQAACAGGFTSIACMPNTNPVLDEESKIRYVVQRAQDSVCRVYPIGSITKAFWARSCRPSAKWSAPAPAPFPTTAGACAWRTSMKNALNYSKSFRIPVICHCEDADLTRGGHMNEGAMSTLLGVWGMPSIAEEVIVARDIMLASYTGRVCILRTCQPPGRCALCATRKNSGPGHL